MVERDPDFDCWLLKFDGATGNNGKELEGPKGFGVIDHACLHPKF